MESESKPPPQVATEAVQAYQDDGVVCLRNVISDQWLDLAHQGVAHNLEHPGRFFSDHTPADYPGRDVFYYLTGRDTTPIKNIIKV